MSSIFDGDWHSYTESTSEDSVLEPDGVFRIVTNAAGTLVPPSNHAGRPITGTINAAAKFIQIFDQDSGVQITYEGTHVHHQVVGGDDRDWACGKYILRQPPPPEGINAPQTLLERVSLTQEEGTWVITKP